MFQLPLHVGMTPEGRDGDWLVDRNISSSRQAL